MCGIVGIVGHGHVNQGLYDALLVLQHRGQDAAGIVTCDGGKLFLRKENGLARDVFDNQHMVGLRGRIGIGHVRYPTAGCASSAEAQPFYVNSPYGIALAHNGNLTNADELKQDLFREDLRHINTESDSEILLNVFAHELQELGKLRIDEKDIFKAVAGVHRRCRGGYAAVALIPGYGLIGFRDPFGIRPIVFGRRDTDHGAEFMIASESVALDVLGFDLIRDVDEFVAEQAGRVKKPESFKWFAGYVRSLRRPMGSVRVDLGEPVVVRRAPAPDDKLALAKIAFEVAVQANRVTPLNVTAVMCLVLLGTAPRGATAQELVKLVAVLADWARDRGIRMSDELAADDRVALRYERGPLFGEVEGAFAARQDQVDSELGESPTPGWGVANLRAGRRFGQLNLTLLLVEGVVPGLALGIELQQQRAVQRDGEQHSDRLHGSSNPAILGRRRNRADDQVRGAGLSSRGAPGSPPEIGVPPEPCIDRSRPIRTAG